MKKFKKACKRAVVSVLSAAMILSSLAGCGSGSSSNGGKKEDPIVLTVFSQRANYSGIQTGWSADILRERFNVELNIIPDQDGVFDTRMESGNLGDILILGDGEYDQAMKAGLLFDWEEDDILADYGPYILESMPYNLEKNRNMNDEGKIYGLGFECGSSSTDLQSFIYTWDIRWDLYKELGYPEVKDLDDLLQLFIDMKEICPTDDAGNPTYAASLWPDWDGDMVMYVKSTATAYYGYDEFGVGFYNPETGEAIGALDEGSPYLEMLEFYHKLYANGLLDPDSMTATYDTMIEKVKKGGTFFSIFNYSGYLAYNTEAHTAENKMMRSLRPEEARPICYGMNVLGGSNYFAIGAKTEYPELCMEVLNYLATPTGMMETQYGPKDVMWYYDEDGYINFTELGKMCNNDKSTTLDDKSDYTGTYHDGELQINCLMWTIDAYNPESNGETYNCQAWLKNQEAAVCDTDQDWRDKTGCTMVDEYFKKGDYLVSPGTGYVASKKSDELKTTWAQVTNCIVDSSWKAIYASSDKEYEMIVQSMIQQANAYGYQECLEWSKNEAARRKAAQDAVTGQQ